MSQKIVALSGAAADVLYALFFRGALHSGNLPSKSGAAELRELGFAETRHTATEYLKTNHFTFLTAEGQAFAIKHLVNTRFGEPAGVTSAARFMIENAPVIANDGDKAKILLYAEMREVVNEVVTDAIRNALRPGGLQYTRK